MTLSKLWGVEEYGDIRGKRPSPEVVSHVTGNKCILQFTPKVGSCVWGKYVPVLDGDLGNI